MESKAHIARTEKAYRQWLLSLRILREQAIHKERHEVIAATTLVIEWLESQPLSAFYNVVPRTRHTTPIAAISGGSHVGQQRYR